MTLTILEIKKIQNILLVLDNNFCPERISYGEINGRFKIKISNEQIDNEHSEQWLAPEIIKKASQSVS